jgi:hypothetical protein
MFEKLKNPNYQRRSGPFRILRYGTQGKVPYIYESPDGGKTVYARQFGTSEPRILVKGESRND